MSVTKVPALLQVRQLAQVSSPSTATGRVGESFSYAIELENYFQLFETTYQTDSSSLPPGIQFNSQIGTFSGTPTHSGTYPVPIEITNQHGTTLFTLTITVAGGQVPVFTGESSFTLESGIPFTHTLQVSNGATHYSATGLPAGVSLNATTGILSGTPTQSGLFNATITASNAAGSSNRSFTFRVDAASLQIASFSPNTLASGERLTITGSGLSTAQSVSFITRFGELVYGTQVTALSDERLRVNVPNLRHVWYDRSPVIVRTPQWTTVTFPASSHRMTAGGTVMHTHVIIGSGSNAAFGGTGGVWAYVESGATIRAASGSGSHKVFLEDGATADFRNSSGGGHLVFKSPGATVLGNTTVVEVSSLVLSLLDQEMLNVYALPIVTSGNAYGSIGDFFTYQIEQDGFPFGEIQFNASGLPPGLSVNRTNGVISGTPTTAGAYTVTLQITDENGSGSKSVQFIISDGGPATLSSGYRIDGKRGQALNVQLSATNNPTAFTASGLPPGITISRSGELSGTPNSSGTWRVPLTIANSHGNSTYILLIAIDRPIPQVTGMPEAVDSRALLELSGSGLEHVESVLFSDRGGWNKEGTIRSTSANSLTVATPELNMLHQAGSAVALFAEGGATVLFPENSTLSSSVIRVKTGETFSSSNGSLRIYAESHSYVSISGGGGAMIFAENDAVIDLSSAGGGNVIIHAPNARMHGVNHTELIEVDDLSPSLVPNLLQIIPLSAIVNQGVVRAYQNVPFFLRLDVSNNPTGFQASGLPDGLRLHTTDGTILGSPTKRGQFSASITITNPNGTSTHQLVFEVGDPFDYWRDTISQDLEGGLSHPRINLVEFASGSDPRRAESSPGLVESFKVVSGTIELTVRRRMGESGLVHSALHEADGIRYILEISEDTHNWRQVEGEVEIVGLPEERGEGIEAVTMRLKGTPLTALAHWLRVRIERLSDAP